MVALENGASKLTVWEYPEMIPTAVGAMVLGARRTLRLVSVTDAFQFV
jgi:hypothetical protein